MSTLWHLQYLGALVVDQHPPGLEQRLQTSGNCQSIQARPGFLHHKALVVAAGLEQELHQQADLGAGLHEEGRDCWAHGRTAVGGGHDGRLWTVVACAL